MVDVRTSRPTQPGMVDLAKSKYEGWSVLLRDGSRLYEANVWNPSLAQLHRHARSKPIRRTSRDTMDFMDVPNDQIMQLEIYFARELGETQPCYLVQREPGNDYIRFIQYKMGGVAVGSGHSEADPMKGQMRTGIYGYKAGTFNWKLMQCVMSEITARGVTPMPIVAHPCWPRPLGHGISPLAVGLTDSQVPPPPNASPLVVPPT